MDNYIGVFKSTSYQSFTMKYMTTIQIGIDTAKDHKTPLMKLPFTLNHSFFLKCSFKSSLPNLQKPNFFHCKPNSPNGKKLE
jgi:hypothetical protein